MSRAEMGDSTSVPPAHEAHLCPLVLFMPDGGWVLSLRTGSSLEAVQGIMTVYEVADFWPSAQPWALLIGYIRLPIHLHYA